MKRPSSLEGLCCSFQKSNKLARYGPPRRRGLGTKSLGRLQRGKNSVQHRSSRTVQAALAACQLLGDEPYFLTAMAAIVVQAKRKLLPSGRTWRASTTAAGAAASRS